MEKALWGVHYKRSIKVDQNCELLKVIILSWLNIATAGFSSGVLIGKNSDSGKWIKIVVATSGVGNMWKELSSVELLLFVWRMGIMAPILTEKGYGSAMVQ